MKREDLLRHREYWIVQIQNDLFDIIEGYMKKNGINRTQLAQKLNVTKGYITQVLNGDFDHKVSKLVDLALASGKVPIVRFVDMEQYIKDDAAGKRNIHNETPDSTPNKTDKTKAKAVDLSESRARPTRKLKRHSKKSY